MFLFLSYVFMSTISSNIYHKQAFLEAWKGVLLKFGICLAPRNIKKISRSAKIKIDLEHTEAGPNATSLWDSTDTARKYFLFYEYEALAVLCANSEMVFSLILPGPVCDDPAEGKRKGRPKAEVQELRSIPVSISLWTEWLEVGFIVLAECRQLPMNMNYIQQSIAITLACIQLSLPHPWAGQYDSTMEGRV